MGHLYHLSEEKAISCFIDSKIKGKTRETSLPSGPAHLKMKPFLNFFFRQLRPATNELELSDNHKKLQKYFPYQSVCKDELNFLHPAETPFVFHSLDQDLDTNPSVPERKLLFAGNLKCSFNPNFLRVDSENGQIYYNSPVPSYFKDPCLVSSSLAIQLSNYFTEIGEISDEYSGISIRLDSNGNVTSSDNDIIPLLYLPKDIQQRIHDSRGEYY